MKRICVLAVLLLAVVSAFALENIRVGNTTRTMISYAPNGLPSQPALVIACHGMNQDAPYLQNESKWETVADTAKFVVVYPNGENKAWDISGNKDVQFLEAIIDTMYQRYHINRNRVYLTGFSMGGMFTYHCANRMCDKIAAFAPVSGYPMGGPNPQATRPVPILHTHGTADDVCVYSSVQSHINAWVSYNGCDPTPEVIKPYPANKPSSPAEMKKYHNGRNGVEVWLLSLANKGHWWSMDESQTATSREVWNFCKNYTLGAEAPELLSIVPENNSFDLLADVNNTFEVTFNEPIDCSRVSATLSSGSKSVTLEVVNTGYVSEVTFKLPAGTELPDGLYTLSVNNAINEGNGKLYQSKFSYAYGVEEVGETLQIDTLLVTNWYDMQTALGEGIPYGWKRINTKSDGTKETTEAGTANVTGCRLKYFVQGGDFDAGFYFSARDFASCLFRYGAKSNYRLSLEAGKSYTLSFNSVYWSDGAQSARATFGISVAPINAPSCLSRSGLLSSGTMSESTAKKVMGSMHHSFDFTAAETAIHMLDFEMAEGWNSVVLGNVMVTTAPSLAERYKGTFYRTLLAAQKVLQSASASAAQQHLQQVVEKYVDLVSTSPTVYMAATTELQAALDAYLATDIIENHLPQQLSGQMYNLQGQPVNKAFPLTGKGVYVVDGRKIKFSN